VRFQLALQMCSTLQYPFLCGAVLFVVLRPVAVPMPPPKARHPHVALKRRGKLRGLAPVESPSQRSGPPYREVFVLPESSATRPCKVPAFAMLSLGPDASL
jgi:hypothetical protein